MKCELFYVPEKERFKFIENYGFDNIAYMGDGLFDAKIIAKAKIGIAPAQARIEAKQVANYITPSNGGEGAYLDAALMLMRTLGVPYEF
jgi:3-deoxy-D-manno-octulosonate 8-phosphate phosphatase KdsC-like HAD superfamily phosphatase